MVIHLNKLEPENFIDATSIESINISYFKYTIAELTG
jgi:hypothetical protein